MSCLSTVFIRLERSHNLVCSSLLLSTDGLYILLKPQKKKAHPSEQPKVPSHLTNHVIREKPPSSCPWSLSGPQFPQPTAIQQRYCYPKGDPEYSSRKGGALWTMYGTDGKENLEYRLLHVYFSAKRAVNKGLSSTGAKSAQSSPPAKRVKRTPPRKPKQQPLLSQLELPLSPARECNSPLSFEITPPSPTMSPIYKSNFVSPHVFDDGSFHSPFRPRILHHDDDNSIQLDHFHLDMDTASSVQELEDACWNDPLFPPDNLGSSTQQHSSSLNAFQSGLEKMHATMRDRILAAPESEQAPLVSLFTTWARQVAQDPLNADESIAQV